VGSCVALSFSAVLSTTLLPRTAQPHYKVYFSDLAKEPSQFQHRLLLRVRASLWLPAAVFTIEMRRLAQHSTT
jgi:hypothetical protein